MARLRRHTDITMQKSISKRIRVTKTGKLVRRSMAIDHFRTRKSTKNLRQKRNTRGLNSVSLKAILR